jgi:hypothetical protein
VRDAERQQHAEGGKGKTKEQAPEGRIQKAQQLALAEPGFPIRRDVGLPRVRQPADLVAERIQVGHAASLPIPRFL